MALTPSRRSELRAQAHKLVPVVIIGDKNGLSDEVLAEIDRSLKAHELIKIRAATDDRDARALWMEKICERLDAQAIQRIGKVLVVYRENFDKPREKPAPAPEPRRPRKKLDPRSKLRTRSVEDDKPKGRRRSVEDDRGSTRTSRPRSRTPSPLPESGLRRRRRSTSR
ncbi:MAG: YhbY family RNA-binding protein [Burkholderiales bacterium]|nr:YhbY family RNA-binding protein [Burkholderiales bacterium]